MAATATADAPAVAALVPLTPRQQVLIRSTVPLLAQHGEAIATLMYQRMLAENPELNNIFNAVHQKTGHQPRALAASLLAYAANDLDHLGGLVELVCHRHASLQVRPEQYAVVGRYLLAAMSDVLGGGGGGGGDDDAPLLTAEVKVAWAAAYERLAQIMIDREAALYRGAAGDDSKSWSEGWRDFRIASKVPESDEITSFYLEPVDGHQPLPAFLPGQYVSVRLRVPGHSYLQARQYSLSEAPPRRPDRFRISVRREEGGLVSDTLHRRLGAGDVVEVSAPRGDFYFSCSSSSSSSSSPSCSSSSSSFPDNDGDGGGGPAPVVLISAGVGLTCLLPILGAVVAADEEVKEEDSREKRRTRRLVSWIHGARSASARAFGAHVRSLAAAHPNVRIVFFASAPGLGEVQGHDYDLAGRVDLRRLDRARDLMAGRADAQYFVCGPVGFMDDVGAALREMGVEPARVHMELFGTSGISRA